MGILWVLAVVCISVFIADYYYNRNVWSATTTSLYSGITICIVLLITGAIASGFPKSVETTLWNTKSIYSLKDAGTTYEGSFVLGNGSINSQDYYAAYVHTADGFYKEKFEQDMTYIKETNSVTPKVEKYIEVTTANWFEGWLLGKHILNGCCYTKYILYVPRDTIIKKFRLE